jgi:hypothetical protein
MKRFISLFIILSVLFFGAMRVKAFTTNSEPAPIGNNWHPGFVEVNVEVIDPASTWFPPTAISKNALQTVLINVEHIVTIGMFRGHTSKTPRYAMLLSNESMLVVHHDYDDLLKLIRASWVGAGKK